MDETTAANPTPTPVPETSASTVPLPVTPPVITNPPISTQTEVEYGGFGERLVAAFIDWFVVGALFTVSFFMVFLIMSMFGVGLLFSKGNTVLGALSFSGIVFAFSMWFFLPFLVSVSYFVYFTAKGATLGKRTLGLKVVNESGNTIGFGKAILRETIGKWVSGMLFGIGYLWVLIDKKHQGWHDKIAGTYVVKTK